jgi:transcriptional antiterminator RfaH
VAFDVLGEGGLNQVSEAKIQKKTEGPAAEPVRVWVVVVTKPGQERRARRELEQQGFDAYLPMKLSMNRKTRELVTMPFFPNYLFAKVSLEIGDWRKVWYTYGVHGLLGSADRPVGVKDAVIERIRAAEEDGFIKIGLEAEGPQFERGQRVQTLDEFGFEGVFQERIDGKRCEILVLFLGRDSRFTVDLRKLKAAGGS